MYMDARVQWLRDAPQLLVPSDDAQWSSDRCHLPCLNLNLPGCGPVKQPSDRWNLSALKTVLHFCLGRHEGVQMFTRNCVSSLRCFIQMFHRNKHEAEYLPVHKRSERFFWMLVEMRPHRPWPLWLIGARAFAVARLSSLVWGFQFPNAGLPWRTDGDRYSRFPNSAHVL